MRIGTETDAEYFGQKDKPAIGSSMLKLWITDPHLYWARHVAKIVPDLDLGAVGHMGHAFEEIVLANNDRRIDSGFKTATAQKHIAACEANPGKIVLTSSDYQTVDDMVAEARKDPVLPALANAGMDQVTYRVDLGPIYIQARIDLDLENDAVPESACDHLQIQSETFDRLLIDLKTTATLYGRYGFRKTALHQFHYPIQAAFYQHVVGLSGWPKSRFLFHATAKDGTGCQWMEFADPFGASETIIKRALSDLCHRYGSGFWDDFQPRVESVLVPENYLQWSEV